MKFVFFILIALLSSCAKQDAGYSTSSDAAIDPAFNSTLSVIAQEFKDNGKTLNMNSSVQFANLEAASSEQVDGICTFDAYGRRSITIDKSYWAKATDTQKLYTLAHEIGHCVLNRMHLNTYTTFQGKSIPASIMYFADIPQYSDSFARAYYFNELVNGG